MGSAAYRESQFQVDSLFLLQSFLHPWLFWRDIWPMLDEAALTEQQLVPQGQCGKMSESRHGWGTERKGSGSAGCKAQATEVTAYLA